MDFAHTRTRATAHVRAHAPSQPMPWIYFAAETIQGRKLFTEIRYPTRFILYVKKSCYNYRQANEETGSFLKTFRGSLELTYLILILSSMETSESEIAMGWNTFSLHPVQE